MEIVSAVVSLIIILVLMYLFYNWLALYTKTKGGDLKTVFERGLVLQYVKPTDTDFTKDERKTLNRINMVIYSLLFGFTILSIKSMIFGWE
jgi:hypothetical protein